MDINLPLDELSNFYREEKKIINQLGLNKKENNTATPSKHVIDRILGYSQALSVRKSKQLGTIEMILN